MTKRRENKIKKRNKEGRQKANNEKTHYHKKVKEEKTLEKSEMK